MVLTARSLLYFWLLEVYQQFYNDGMVEVLEWIYRIYSRLSDEQAEVDLIHENITYD